MTLLARAVRGRAGPRGVGTGICAAPWGNRPEPSIPIGLRGPPTCRHRVWRMGWEPSGRAFEDHTRGMGSRGDRGQGSWATCCCSGLPRERPSPSPTPASLVSVADLCPRLVTSPAQRRPGENPAEVLLGEGRPGRRLRAGSIAVLSLPLCPGGHWPHL